MGGAPLAGFADGAASSPPPPSHPLGAGASNIRTLRTDSTPECSAWPPHRAATRRRTAGRRTSVTVRKRRCSTGPCRSTGWSLSAKLKTAAASFQPSYATNSRPISAAASWRADSCACAAPTAATTASSRSRANSADSAPVVSAAEWPARQRGPARVHRGRDRRPAAPGAPARDSGPSSNRQSDRRAAVRLCARPQRSLSQPGPRRCLRHRVRREPGFPSVARADRRGRRPRCPRRQPQGQSRSRPAEASRRRASLAAR